MEEENKLYYHKNNRDRSEMCYCHQNNMVYISYRSCARHLGINESGIRRYRKDNWNQYRGYTFCFNMDILPSDAKYFVEDEYHELLR